jgi:uncharacterized membrane protein YeiH
MYTIKYAEYFAISILTVTTILASSEFIKNKISLLFIGIFTALGGGTFRDILIYRKKPFFFKDYEYLINLLNKNHYYIFDL